MLMHILFIFALFCFKIAFKNYTYVPFYNINDQHKFVCTIKSVVLSHKNSTHNYWGTNKKIKSTTKKKV